MSITRKIFILICGLILGTALWVAAAIDWHELKGDHFIVYFSTSDKAADSGVSSTEAANQDSKFAQEVLDKAEVYYRNIATDLGYPRYSQFWLWDKRAKVYIFPDRGTFLRETGQPEWSQGMAEYKGKKIMSFSWSQVFLDSILPHEIAHLVFRDFVGFEGDIPLWLDEGVAQWEEELKRDTMKAMAKKRLNEGSLLTIEDMMKLDIRSIRDRDRLYIRPAVTKDGTNSVLFLSGDSLVATYYLEAVSLVGFLIERYGGERFAAFCREMRDGKPLAEALKFAYPTQVNDLKELQDEWRKYVLKN
jgi:hypothetical protein